MAPARPNPAETGSWLRRSWQTRGLVSAVLWPLSLLYGAVTAIHRQLYRSGIRSVTRVGIPVIVVGNITAGGGGKTPTVMEIATPPARARAAGGRGLARLWAAHFGLCRGAARRLVRHLRGRTVAAEAHLRHPGLCPRQPRPRGASAAGAPPGHPGHCV